ncbi:hypothetical protein DWX80_18860 [Ruminococcus sp. AF21-3]|nr:hypothetical protein DWX80_18860 [Ruminococcus sp. AF21-3]
MTEILILSSKNYPDSETINYGDCILIKTDTDFVIYDCGHDKHAEVALSFMDNHNIPTAKVILSHNDSDHFDGIQKLLDSGRITVIKLRFSSNIKMKSSIALMTVEKLERVFHNKF